MSKHYDVVVLGGSIGALVCAALLARRSWRVLVLGQGHLRQGYECGGHELRRRTFTWLTHASPAFGRVLVELAQSQTFRRHVVPSDPMFAVLAPSFRLEVPPDQGLFAKELDREFPEIRRVVDDLYVELARANGIIDAAFERDAVLPPGSFWERRDVARTVASLPHAHEGADVLAEFAKEHPYRNIVATSAEFASNLAAPLPMFALARLHGAWTRGVQHIPGGEEALAEFLLERVRAHGGDTRMQDRASSIDARGGKVRGVRVDGEEESYGVSFVLSDRATSDLLELTGDFSVSKRATEKTTHVIPQNARFVVSLVAKSEALPERLPIESFLTSKAGDLPVVHLQALPGKMPGTSLLVAETIVKADANVARLREQVLCAIEEHLPFVAPHVLLCDSPHDGRPLWDFRTGKRVDVDRARLRGGGGSLDKEPMTPLYRTDPPTFLGLGGEPLRTPLTNAFVVGPTVLPALGQEGEIIAAWSVARIITRTDRRKEKMRRDMWSKVELA